MGEALIIIIPIWILLSIFSGMVSQNKGRGFGIGFWIALLVSPLIGFIVAGLLEPSKEVAAKELLEKGQLKKCPKCAEMIKSEAVRCRFCGNENF